MIEVDRDAHALDERTFKASLRENSAFLTLDLLDAKGVIELPLLDAELPVKLISCELEANNEPTALCAPPNGSIELLNEYGELAANEASRIALKLSIGMLELCNDPFEVMVGSYEPVEHWLIERSHDSSFDFTLK